MSLKLTYGNILYVDVVDLPDNKKVLDNYDEYGYAVRYKVSEALDDTEHQIRKVDIIIWKKSNIYFDHTTARMILGEWRQWVGTKSMELGAEFIDSQPGIASLLCAELEKQDYSKSVDNTPIPVSKDWWDFIEDLSEIGGDPVQRRIPKDEVRIFQYADKSLPDCLVRRVGSTYHMVNCSTGPHGEGSVSMLPREEYVQRDLRIEIVPKARNVKQLLPTADKCGSEATLILDSDYIGNYYDEVLMLNMVAAINKDWGELHNRAKLNTGMFNELVTYTDWEHKNPYTNITLAMVQTILDTAQTLIDGGVKVATLTLNHETGALRRIK